MITQQTKAQYNGFLLLTSYLHRLYVSERIQMMLNQKEDTVAKDVKAMLDDVNMMRAMFEQSKVLLPTQQTKLVEMLEKVKVYMNDFMPGENADFAAKLTVVTASLFGEQAMNDGILRMKEVLGFEAKGDFEARVKFYKDRTMAMDKMVHHLEKKQEIPKNLQNLVVQWYDNIDKQHKLVFGDLEKIDKLIMG